MVWLLVCWCLASVPLGVVVGRCIAAADRPHAAPDDAWPSEVRHAQAPRAGTW